jgi:hypothetical protein
MVVRPRVVPHATVDGLVGISCAFCAEFPDCPFFAVFRVEELDELVEGVAVGELGVCL